MSITGSTNNSKTSYQRQSRSNNSRSSTPVGSRASTPVGSRASTPVGSRASTPVGSRSSSPAASRMSPLSGRSTQGSSNDKSVWVMTVDVKSGRNYWYNKFTRESTWKIPMECLP